jgi:cytoskeleton protein RodZ
MAEIGKTLRETRNRQRIDLASVEAATKIRVRYLRAIENEEWDVLPGEAYARSFIRTYANHVGLDGERLADEFRRLTEGPPRVPHRPEPVPARRERRPGGGGPRLPAGALAGLIALVLIGILVAIGLAGGGGDEGEPMPKPDRQAKQREKKPRPVDRRVDLRLTASAPVWVCVIDADGREVVDGLILSTGQSAGPFRSAGFLISFGNGAIEMDLDGEPVPLEESPNPVGYRVGREGGVRPLDEADRPTCT